MMLQIKRIITLFVLVGLLISADLPAATAADQGGSPVPPSLICAPGAGAKPATQRILLIGGLLSEEIDIHLRGLIAAGRPPCAVEVSSVILPAT